MLVLGGFRVGFGTGVVKAVLKLLVEVRIQRFGADARKPILKEQKPSLYELSIRGLFFLRESLKRPLAGMVF